MIAIRTIEPESLMFDNKSYKSYLHLKDLVQWLDFDLQILLYSIDMFFFALINKQDRVTFGQHDLYAHFYV